MSNARRDFLKRSALAAGGFLMTASSPALFNEYVSRASFGFKISLAEWSLNKEIFSGEISNLDFPAVAKERYGIDAVEYVNQFFPDKSKDHRYLKELKKRAGDQGVRNVLIMIDNEGLVASDDEAERNAAVQNHYKWMEAAKLLGCHAVRVNLFGSQDREDDVKAWISSAVDGLGKLAEYGAQLEINVLVENHGGLSSHAGHLAKVIKQVDSNWCGTLPDFGNFCISYQNNARWGESCEEKYDVYKGTEELMPFAKGVSAKTFAFDEKGNETTLDYKRLMKIVKASGFNGGYVGIEYEGNSMAADQGIMATKKLLEKIRAELA